ncbi:MAG: PilN domain-containing protein [Elusimicrobiota bacterium]
MFEINIIKKKVLPEEYKKKVHQYIRISLYIGGTILLLIGGFIFFNSSRISKYKLEKEKLSLGIEKMRNKYNINKREKEWRNIYKKIILINKAIKERKTWSSRLQELAILLPDMMCIENIQISDKGKELDLRITSIDSGKEDFETINKFVSDLRKSKYFSSEVKLESQEKKNIRGKDALQYLVSVKLSEKKENE